MKSKWIFKSPPIEDVDMVCKLTGMPHPIAKHLASIGMTTNEKLEEYLHPNYSKLLDPFDIPVMEDACTRIWKCILENKLILVYGDYDVDGITSSALLTRALKKLNANVDVFVPSRKDGYGFSIPTMEKVLKDLDPTLVITVDCGINSKDTADFLESKGIDVIITDHHEPDETVALPHLIINPKLFDIPRILNMSGAGVAFKLVQGILDFGRRYKHAGSFETDCLDFIDIATLGTVADIVPLQEENRIIANEGLKVMPTTKNPGIKALLNLCGLYDKVDASNISFKLAPRINAVGRMGNPRKALDLLLTDDICVANQLAIEIDNLNIERRILTTSIEQEALKYIDKNIDIAKTRSIVVVDKWDDGVLGIIASRITEKYNIPAIVMTLDEEKGVAKGSCRSVDQISILDGLNMCSDLLTRFGGHKYAAGLELPIANLEEFTKKIDIAIRTQVPDNVILEPKIKVTSLIEESDVNWDFIENVNKLEPFGYDNQEPRWCLKEVKIIYSKLINDKHLQLTLDINGKPVKAIMFNYNVAIDSGTYVDLVFYLKENNWKGNMSIQLHIIDLDIV
jgi:single-stranded-DNA-specific exonuclease